jgi:YD repeat-containing protein
VVPDYFWFQRGKQGKIVDRNQPGEITMSTSLKQSTISKRKLLMVSASNHVNGLAGLTLTVLACKTGDTTFSARHSATAIVDLGNGWYDVELDATDTGQLGDLAVHAEATGADPTDRLFVVESADLTDLDTEMDAILVKTNNLPASPAATGDAMTLTSGERTSIGSAVWGSVTRTLSAFGFNVTASSVTDKTGYSLATPPPTAASIVSAMDTTSTKLALVDAAISSRASAASVIGLGTPMQAGARPLGPRIQSATFNPSGDFATVTWAGGVVWTYNYDANGKLTGITE